MMMVEDIKKDFNNSLREIQENTAKQVKDLKEQAQKSLKELEENTTKQVMELNKTIQDLKREVDTIKKTQSEAMLEIENLGEKRRSLQNKMAPSVVLRSFSQLLPSCSSTWSKFYILCSGASQCQT
jgi:predicted  nucleic acid-binding Zn-ribbon protein